MTPLIIIVTTIIRLVEILIIEILLCNNINSNNNCNNNNKNKDNINKEPEYNLEFQGSIWNLQKRALFMKF